MSNPNRRAGKSHSAPITVGDGARISTRSVVLPGVTVGEGAAVGAGSVVKYDCKPHTLYVGTPAQPKRELPQ
ncbi:acyltransferase [Rhodococcus ruber]